MTDLETFRDHARAMSTAEHSPKCVGHAPTRWGWQQEVRPNPRCTGCVSPLDRALWGRLADEVDEYLGDEMDDALEGL